MNFVLVMTRYRVFPGGISIQNKEVRSGNSRMAQFREKAMLLKDVKSKWKCGPN